jgi:hypothetical protein
MAKINKAWFQGQQEESHEGKITSNNPEKLGFGGKEGIEYDRKPMETTAPGGQDSRPFEIKKFEGEANKTKQVMGPKGSEFEMKKHWQRIPEDEKIANASIKLGLKKNASNPVKSTWTMYADGQPVLTADMADIWGPKLKGADAKKILEYGHSKEYGQKVLAKLKSDGFAVVSYLMTGDETLVKKAMELNKSLVKKADLNEAPVEEELESLEATPEEDSALDAEIDNLGAETEAGLGIVEQKLEELEEWQTKIVEKTAPAETVKVFLMLQEAEKGLLDAQKEGKEVSAKLKEGKKLTAAGKIKLIKIAVEAQEAMVEDAVAADDAIEAAETSIDTLVEKADEAIEAAKGIVEGGEAAVEGGEPENLEGAIEISEEPVEEAVEASFVGKFLKAQADRRTKLASEEYGVVPAGSEKDAEGLVEKAHPGKYEVPDVSVGGKPADDGAEVEDQVEQAVKIEKVVNKMPTGELSSKGAGKGTTKTADSKSEEYWKNYYAQANAKEFGTDMNKDIDGGNKIVASMDEFKGRVKRAYELVETAVERGFCKATKEAKAELVEQVLNFDDKAFMSYKKAVESAPVMKKSASTEELVKTASFKAVQVGQKENGISAVENDGEFISKLANLDWK